MERGGNEERASRSIIGKCSQLFDLAQQKIEGDYKDIGRVDSTSPEI